VKIIAAIVPRSGREISFFSMPSSTDSFYSVREIYVISFWVDGDELKVDGEHAVGFDVFRGRVE
jgi:hypothetical protein